ncbi:hypothetical protein [Rhabdothermincola salaria]|uniref:hypothetical protein n=1 Tax=Rhabdothermincola salaria TaxID=2903142 RepID=UPI001E5B47FF|nr:hypothetical protein [Rhabdothermincola salaria]MCD9625698.1 hypothetical protein [Rhabdothermincola salaria]
MATPPDPTDSAAQEPEVHDRTEARYRRGVGITLAVLALLGGWIAVLATDAGTNESRTTRQATRLASESQTAAVVDQGVKAGIDQTEAEMKVFASRPGFRLPEIAAEEGAITLDPDAEQGRVEEATAVVERALTGDAVRATEISEEARALALEHKQLVAERITWNNRASQYETVLTTLAVAIFLVGFTMVVSRGLRPPFVVPGMILAVFCFGWAIQIYLKPIPDVAPEAITSSATGQVALDEGRATDAVAAFADAVTADDGYQIAHRGLGLSTLVEANPDLLRTFAITDNDPDLLRTTAAQLEVALREGGDEDPTTVATAALATLVGADWARTAELLELAIGENQRTPGLALTRSAVAIAEGDAATAEEWLRRALEFMAPLAGSDVDRALAAQYLTALEWVEDRAPEQTDLVEEFRARSMRFVAEARADQTPGVDLAPAGTPPPDASVTIETLAFADDRTTVELDIAGVGDDDQVIIAIYERPAPGASWIQPSELFYVGLPTDGQGITLSTPRACAPVEYRVDLYVDGVSAATATAPGTTATC